MFSRALPAVRALGISSCISVPKTSRAVAAAVVYCRRYHKSVQSQAPEKITSWFDPIIHPDVQQALSKGKAVVALESTIITHGMPYPANKEAALAVEQIVRDNGAVPATICILDGRVHVGCTKDEIETLAKTGFKARKTSRRDIAMVVAAKGTGATTVSGTMVIAHKAGIKVFVTGGLGGVHRGGQDTMDISADVMELGRTPVTIVSAGVKSILDIPRTLECLETQGVTTVAYSETKDFPAFFCRRMGGNVVAKAMTNMTKPEEVAQLILANSRLNIDSGMLVAVPIPEEYAKDPDVFEKIVDGAFQESKAKNIAGADVTPFLLERVNELTGGESLEANIELVKNNAKIGSEIAVELSRLEQIYPVTGKPSIKIAAKGPFSPRVNKQLKNSRTIVIGGALIDIRAKCGPQGLVAQTSNPGIVRESFGGVGRNVAENLARLGHAPLFISVVGNDIHGQSMKNHASTVGVNIEGLLTSGAHNPTARYVAVLNPQGELEVAVADVAVLNELTPEWISPFANKIRSASMVCLDGNLSAPMFQHICTMCRTAHIPVLFEPTSVAKAALPVSTNSLRALSYISPNGDELNAMATGLRKKHTMKTPMVDIECEVKKVLKAFPTLEVHKTVIQDSIVLLKEGVRNIITTLGPRGSIALWTKKQHGVEGDKAKVYATVIEALPLEKRADVTGAGDSFVAAMMAGLVEGRTMEQSLAYGMMVARKTIQSFDTVDTELSPETCTVEKVNEVYTTPASFNLTDFVDVSFE